MKGNILNEVGEIKKGDGSLKVFTPFGEMQKSFI